MSYSCPHLDQCAGDHCRRRGQPCAPGAPGCVLVGKAAPLPEPPPRRRRRPRPPKAAP